MAKLGISTGTVPDDGLGDSLLDGAVKINSNFDEIYTYFGDGTNLTFIGGSSSQWQTTSSGIHTLSNVGIGTTSPTENLTVVGDARVTGILTVGTASITLDGNTETINVGSGVTIDGSSGIIQASSVVIDGTTLTGTAVTSITAGSGISVDQSTGNVTISATGGGGGESYWEATDVGIHTLSNVGVGTINPTSALTVKGNTSLETLSVSGISTFSDVNIKSGNSLVLGSQSQQGGGIRIWNQNNSSTSYFDLKSVLNTIYLENKGANSGGIFIRALSNVTLGGGDNLYSVECSGDEVRLFYDDVQKLRTTGTGVTVTGTTFTNQLSVSGISTLTSNVSIGGTISVDGGVKLATNNETIVGTSATAGEIKRIGGAPFFYDGSAWREFVLSSGTPVTVPADTDWDSVIFRATFDDDFTDAKFGATPVFVSAGSSIVGAPVKIGTGAYRNDGSVGAGISYAYRDEYDFTGSWTIEFWMYVDSGPTYYAPATPASLVSMYTTTGIGTSGNWSLAMKRDQFNNVYIEWFNSNHPSYKNGTTLYNISGPGWGSVIQDKWNHFTLVRESNNGSLHFYVNGIEQITTSGSTIIDNDILNINGNGLHIGGDTTFTVGSITFNSNESADVIIDDLRISAGVGTAGQRYTSVGISTIATFTPPTTELPTTGTLSSYIQPPGDKYGEIGLGTSPTWRGTSGVTVSQQSSGNYRVSFASTYTNSNDYFVLSHPMDQGFASYVGIARSTTHVDFSINKQSDDTAVDTGALSVQITNHK
jgi:hypothetical protein